MSEKNVLEQIREGALALASSRRYPSPMQTKSSAPVHEFDARYYSLTSQECFDWWAAKTAQQLTAQQFSGSRQFFGPDTWAYRGNSHYPNHATLCGVTGAVTVLDSYSDFGLEKPDPQELRLPSKYKHNCISVVIKELYARKPAPFGQESLAR